MKIGGQDGYPEFEKEYGGEKRGPKEPASTEIFSTSCSWCHEENPVSHKFCILCGHEAHKPRLMCQCIACKAQKARYEAEQEAKIAEEKAARN